MASFTDLCQVMSSFVTQISMNKQLFSTINYAKCNEKEKKERKRTGNSYPFQIF